MLWTLRSGARTYWTLKIQGWMQRHMRFPTWCEINESGGFWRLENTLLSLQVAPQVGRDSKASLSNQLSLFFSFFPLPVGLQIAKMPWGWPQATLQTLRSRHRGSTVSRGHCWQGAASASTAHACALAKARLEQVPSIHAYAGVPPGGALPSCQGSATLHVATNPLGDRCCSGPTPRVDIALPRAPHTCALSLQGSGPLTWPGWTTPAPSTLGAPLTAMPGSR